VEQVELTLPEDLSQVSKEVRKDLLHARSVMLLTVDQLINVLSGTEGITPDLHLKSNLELMITELKNLLKSIFLIKFDREGDLRLD
jgi:hypothetical protein